MTSPISVPSFDYTCYTKIITCISWKAERLSDPLQGLWIIWLVNNGTLLLPTQERHWFVEATVTLVTSPCCVFTRTIQDQITWQSSFHNTSFVSVVCPTSKQCSRLYISTTFNRSLDKMFASLYHARFRNTSQNSSKMQSLKCRNTDLLNGLSSVWFWWT